MRVAKRLCSGSFREEQWNKHEYSHWPPPSTEDIHLEGNHFLFALQQQESGQDAVWEVTRLWAGSITDITFLYVTPVSQEAEASAWRNAITMQLAPPAVGERIVGFGYREMVAGIDMDEENQRIEISWNASPMTTVGEVTEVYDKRGPGLCQWPSFRVNARFEPGMSGGPVFNDAGRLCGIICSSFEVGDDVDQEISYVSSLWPAMATSIAIDREGHPPGSEYPVLDLARTGAIHAVDHEAVELVRDENGRLTPSLRKS
jgi:Trypsin-like peptidase domain